MRIPYSCIVFLFITLFNFNLMTASIYESYISIMVFVITSINTALNFDSTDTIKITNALMRNRIETKPPCLLCNVKHQYKTDISYPNDIAITTILNSAYGSAFITKSLRANTNATFVILCDEVAYNSISNYTKSYIESCGAIVVKLTTPLVKNTWEDRYRVKIRSFHSILIRFAHLINRVAFFDSNDLIFQDYIFNDHEYDIGLTMFTEPFTMSSVELFDMNIKAKEDGLVNASLFANKHIVNGCCGAGDTETVFHVMDLILNDMNHHPTFVDQGMFNYYYYYGLVPGFRTNNESMWMGDQTEAPNATVLGEIRPFEDTQMIPGKWKWLHHLHMIPDEKVRYQIYRHCYREDSKIEHYTKILTDKQVEHYNKNVLKLNNKEK